MGLGLWVAIAAVGAGAGDRVGPARARHVESLRQQLADHRVTYPPAIVLLRAFKQERELELWVGNRGEALQLARRFPICAASGELGPKRRFGDLQVPEGIYEISWLNPRSQFHLSMKVSYPNRSDRLRGGAGSLGGDIFIHGGCASVGCLALGDEAIEALYVLIDDARAKGAKVPVHVFPARLSQRWLEAHAASPHRALWEELKVIDGWFETHRRVPRIEVLDDGAYRLRAQ